MKIKVNNMNYEFNENTLSITQILKKLNYTFPIIIVKHHDLVIKNEDFDKYYIEDKDEITILHIFAGG